MPEGRPAIPIDLDRAVREEAGHRCAIPTCRSTAALHMAHIVPWAQVKEHSFENLILLCANDHFRYDAKEISRTSMRNYKANLSILNTRYSDTERRVLEWFADNGLDKALLLEGGTLLELTTRNLVRDGLVQVTDARGFRSVSRLTLSDGRQLGMIPASLPRLYELTALGRESAEKWLRAALMG